MHINCTEYDEQKTSIYQENRKNGVTYGKKIGRNPQGPQAI